MATQTISLGWREQGSTEVRPWSVSWVDAMDSGDAVASVVVTLTDLLTGALYPAGLSGSATTTTNTTTQSVGSLAVGHNYRLTFTASMGGSKQSSESLFLTVPW